MQKPDTAIDRSALTKAALTLYQEAYYGPTDPKATWFADNLPDCGVLGTIASLSADEASRPLHRDEAPTVASHAAHLRFALNLANRAGRGEDAYAGAKWSTSWDTRSVTEAEWKDLLDGLNKEFADFKEILASGKAWESEESITGNFGVIAHGAWHLGAIRQALGFVKAPA